MTTVASRQVRMLLLMLATAFPLSAVAPEKNGAVVTQTLTQRVQNFKQHDIEVLAGMAQAGTLPVVYPQENVRVQALLLDAMATIDGLLALAKQNKKYEAILDQFLNTFTGVAREVPKMDRSAVQALRDKTAACVTDLGEAAVRGADRGAELANNLYLTMARTLQPQAFSNGNLFKAFARKWKGFTKTQKTAAILIPVAVASAAGVATYLGVKHHQDKKAEEELAVAEKARQKAATLIQARVRGRLVRGGGAERARQAAASRKAATLIQARVRGRLVRGGGAERIRQAAAPRHAEEARAAEEVRLAAERAAEAAGKAEQARKAEAARKAEEVRLVAERAAEAAGKAEQARKAEAAQKAEAARQEAERAARQPVEGFRVKMTLLPHGSPSAPDGSPMRGRRVKLIAKSTKSQGTSQELTIGAIRNAGRQLQDIDRGANTGNADAARDALLGFFSHPAWAKDNYVDATLRNVFGILGRDPVTGNLPA